MKISAKGRYGLKAMIDIAVYGDSSYISLKSIAERQKISEAYLEQIIAPLKKAGFVKSTRGSMGGYSLGMAAENIFAGSILNVLNESLSISDCGLDNSGCGDDCDCCVSKSVWKKIGESANEAAFSISLNEMAENYKVLKGLC